MLGNIKFIGELGKLDLIHESILHKCIKTVSIQIGWGLGAKQNIKKKKEQMLMLLWESWSRSIKCHKNVSWWLPSPTIIFRHDREVKSALFKAVGIVSKGNVVWPRQKDTVGASKYMHLRVGSPCNFIFKCICLEQNNIFVCVSVQSLLLIMNCHLQNF